MQYGLAITITALSLPGMGLTAAFAAPTASERDQCYGSCYSRCAAQHSCRHRNASRECFTHYNECKKLCRTSCSH